MTNKIKIPFLLSVLMLTTAANAQDKQTLFNPVHTAMVSQAIAPDARAGGMGDVGVATDADVSSQYWNPAKYPFAISKAGVQLNYTPWLRKLVNDMNIAYLSGYYRIGDYSAVSASLHYFSLGEVYTSSGGTSDNYDMTIKPYEMSIDAGYSMMLSEKFSLGAAVRYMFSDMSYSSTEEKKTSGAFAADIAGYYQNYINIGKRECQLGLGFNISNIGSKMNLTGTDLKVPIDEYNAITVAADVNKLLVPTYPTTEQYEKAVAEGKTTAVNLEQYADEVYYNVGSIAGIFKSFGDAPGGFKEEMKEIQLSVGAEYCYNDRFSVRAGYHDEAETKGNRKYFTIGAGFKMSAFSLDAAYVISTASSNPLDQTLRFSLAFDIDGIKDLFGRK